jgi:hypothetical protein
VIEMRMLEETNEDVLIVERVIIEHGVERHVERKVNEKLTYTFIPDSVEDLMDIIKFGRKYFPDFKPGFIERMDGDLNDNRKSR